MEKITQQDSTYLIDLNEEELRNTDGGLLINIFLWGVAYGYVVEKLDSGQW